MEFPNQNLLKPNLSAASGIDLRSPSSTFNNKTPFHGKKHQGFSLNLSITQSQFSFQHPNLKHKPINMFADDHHMHSLLHIMLIMLASVMMLGIGNSQTTSTIVPNVVQTLPAYMYTDCYDVSAHGTPGNDSHIGTMAKMMDYCGCENPINPIGLVYAGSKLPKTSA